MARASDIFLKRSRGNDATVWKNINGVKFHIASVLNESYQKGVNKTGDHEDAYYTKQVAEHLLLDWKGLDNDDGTPMNCNLDNKIMLLTTYAEIGNRILEIAISSFNFVACNKVDEELKN